MFNSRKEGLEYQELVLIKLIDQVPKCKHGFRINRIYLNKGQFLMKPLLFRKVSI